MTALDMCIDTERALANGTRRGVGSFIFPNTNLIAVLKRLNCLVFAIGVLLYYVKSLSSSVDMENTPQGFPQL